MLVGFGVAGRENDLPGDRAASSRGDGLFDAELEEDRVAASDTTAWSSRSEVWRPQPKGATVLESNGDLAPPGPVKPNQTPLSTTDRDRLFDEGRVLMDSKQINRGQ